MISSDISQKLKIISLLSMIMVIFLHSFNIKDQDNYFFESNTVISFTTIFIQNIFSQGLTRMAVPIFFLMSGFLLFQNFNLLTYKNKISKRIYTLLIPYFFWTTLTILIFFILQSIPGVSHFFNNTFIKDLPIKELFIKLWVNPQNYPLWFLRDLILLTILSPLIFYFIKNLPRVYLFIIFTIWFFELITSSIDISFYKPEAVLFFSIGAYGALISDKLLSIKVSNKFFMYLIFLYFILLLPKALFFTIYPNESQIFIITIIHKISILLGIATLWFLLDKYKFTLLSPLTGFTFLFYVFHEPALTILKKGSFAIFGKTPLNCLLSYFIIPIIILILLSFLGIILKKYFPKIGSIITGNRL